MITTSIDAGEERYLRRAVELARLAREAGDRPYGAVLVGEDGRVLAEGRNATVSDGDPTSHAELNAVRAARVAPPGLTGATMYASGEPCAMCSAAMAWAGVTRVVFGASIPAIRAVDPSPGLTLRCADVMAAAPYPVEVIGPVLEEECLAVFTS